MTKIFHHYSLVKKSRNPIRHSRPEKAVFRDYSAKNKRKDFSLRFKCYPFLNSTISSAIFKNRSCTFSPVQMISKLSGALDKNS